MKTHNTNSKTLVKRVFQDVFEKYDLMNDLMSLGIHRLWKKDFVHYLNPQKNTSLIDVASGTGDIAKLYLDKINYNGSVCCVDENQEMLNLNKIKLKKNSKVRWFCNRAEKLPFKNNSFDYYTISFGIRNVDNLNDTLTEAYRVLKPGCRFLCLEFSKVKNETFDKFYKTYSKLIPQMGKFVLGKSEPYQYLINSIEEFYSQEDFFKQIKKQNFENVSYRNLSGGIVAIHSAWKV